VYIRRSIEPLDLFEIDFYTLFADESFLLTVNGKANYSTLNMSNSIVQDAYTGKTSIQWQLHQDKLSQLTTTNTSVDITPDRFIKALQNDVSKYIDFLIKTKKIVPFQNTDLFQYTWRSAWQKSFQLVNNSSKSAIVIKQRLELAKTEPNIYTEIPIELEVSLF
jgi:hypothetical protein